MCARACVCVCMRASVYAGGGGGYQICRVNNIRFPWAFVFCFCFVFPPKAMHFADRTSPHLQSIDTDIQLLATQAITPFNVYLQALPIDDTQSDHTINRQYSSYCEHLETTYTNCTDSQFPESAQATRKELH